MTKASGWRTLPAALVLLILVAGAACRSDSALKAQLEQTQSDLTKTQAQVGTLQQSLDQLKGELESTRTNLAATSADLSKAKADAAKAQADVVTSNDSLNALKNTALQELDRLKTGQDSTTEFQRLMAVVTLVDMLSITFTEEAFNDTKDAMRAVIRQTGDQELMAVWNAVAPTVGPAGPEDAEAWDIFLALLRQRLLATVH